MKLVFKRTRVGLFSIFCEGKYGEVIFSSSVDNILLAILMSLGHNAGSITYSLFKSKKTCIGVRSKNGRWVVTYSNTPATVVGDIIVICNRGFKQNVGKFITSMFRTHYFVIETYDDGTDSVSVNSVRHVNPFR